MAPTDAVSGQPFFRVADGTSVALEIVSADPALSLEVNGTKLHQPGDTALLGVMPTIHVHPSWQIVVPGDAFGDYSVSFKLTTDSTLYAGSMLYTQLVTNVQPPVSPTPTPLPTPLPTECAGDCSGDGTVAINELITCVDMALGVAAADTCRACDANGDGAVSIGDIVAAVNAALDGCPKPMPVGFSGIQDMIFTRSCATAFCHDALSYTGNLDLTPEHAYAQLVNVPPDIVTAASAGLLRVKPGDPAQSFLLIKLNGPPPDQGSRMPLSAAPLSAEQIRLVTDWIVQGASP